MSNIFILNAHHHYDFSPGRLNRSLVEKAVEILEGQGHQLRWTESAKHYAPETEIAHHQWADIVIMQSPVNWMGVPWSAKKYMDEVYSAGLQGQLCNGDGRSSENPKANYGAGGTLTGKQYMLSLTFNAPQEAFDDANEYLFQGKSVDDLFFPAHMNFRFFGMMPLPTFACYDVMKNPTIDTDFARFEAHLREHIPAAQ